MDGKTPEDAQPSNRNPVKTDAVGQPYSDTRVEGKEYQGIGPLVTPPNIGISVGGVLEYPVLPVQTSEQAIGGAFDRQVELEHTTQPGIFVGGRELSNAPASPTPETPPKVPARSGILTTIRRKLGH